MKNGRRSSSAQLVLNLTSGHENIKIFSGESYRVLKKLPSNSLDSCVTDPPYELGFMGKKWDSTGIAYSVDLWREVLRVLKPGALLLSFGGTRTYHRMACAIEDAGFEIRDQLQWLYGSGFPKSLDVSKAIDRSRTEDQGPVRAICRFIRSAMERKGLKSRDLVGHFGGCHTRLIDHWAARDTDSQPSLPTWDQWIKLKNVLGLSDYMDAEVWRLDGRKGTPGKNWDKGKSTGTANDRGGFCGERLGIKGNPNKAIAASQESAEWSGYGTALKPANEPICLARKPLSEKTVAANVLKWGVGALNIDACRIGAGLGGSREGEASKDNRYSQNGATNFAAKPGPRGGDAKGRFPANVILDEEAGKILDGQSGNRKAGGNLSGREPSRPAKNTYGEYKERRVWDSYQDSGGASRFFYCAKASRRERGEGNTHPTVKPVALMSYLVRLVTPPAGVILDPFLGSGTTGLAARKEGFGFFGIEKENSHIEIAKKRLGL